MASDVSLQLNGVRATMAHVAEEYGHLVACSVSLTTHQHMTALGFSSTLKHLSRATTS